MALVTVNEFVNKYSLTLTDFNASDLAAYIDRYEEITLIELFGKELYDLWVAGLVGSDPLYTYLRDPFTVQLSCGTILKSRGVNDMICGVVYFYWSRDIITQQSSNGAVEKLGENSTIPSLFRANIQSRWNEAIDTYCSIQGYICENSSDYPTFLGQTKTILPIF
jgi:hypothetical protein